MSITCRKRLRTQINWDGRRANKGRPIGNTAIDIYKSVIPSGDRDIVLKQRRIRQVVVAGCAAVIDHRYGIKHPIGTIGLLGNGSQHLCHGDVRQVFANLVALFRCAVVVQIQRRRIVQALAGQGAIRRYRAGCFIRITTRRVDVVAAVGRTGRQVQPHIVRQHIGLRCSGCNRNIICQRIRLAVDSRQRRAANRRNHVHRAVGCRLNGNVVVKRRRIDQVIRARCAAEVFHNYRVRNRVRPIRIRYRAHGHHIFAVRDIRQVAADFVCFFRRVVVVQIQARHVVQAFARSRIARRAFSASRVNIVAAGAGAQIQRHVIGQRIDLYCTRCD